MKLTSLKLVEHLKDRSRKAAGAKASAAITVPDELSWWYFQEFGTASRMDPDAPSGTGSPEGYPIVPINGKALRLPIAAGHPTETIVAEVGPPHTLMHPGVHPKSFVRSILPEIASTARVAAMQALGESALDATAVREVLLNEVMPKVVDMIAESMAASGLAQRRTDGEGKLGSESPSEAFKSAAQIVDTSE
jgi:hypothetical protein